MRFRIFTISLLFLFVFSCKKNDFAIENLNGNSISIIGHGGMGISSIYPLNSFESLSKALYLGADGIEIDVQLTSDGVFVACHDYDLSHNTSGSGMIYQQTWDDIKDVRYKTTPYTSYQLITLEQVFEGLHKNFKDKLFILDCKVFNPDRSEEFVYQYCNSLLRLIDRYGLSNNVIVEFKREDMIAKILSLRPGIKVMLYADDPLLAITLAERYPIYGVNVALTKINRQQVTQLHEAGIKVSVFNAHSNQRNVDAINKNVDFIQTDRLKHLLGLLK